MFIFLLHSKFNLNRAPMAPFIFPPATPSQLCYFNKNGLFSPTKCERGMKITCHAASIPAAAAIERRKLTKLLLFGAAGLPAAALMSVLFPPPGGGTLAKDEDGYSIVASKWLKTHGPGDKTLTQGLKGDPTYLVVENNKALATYGINAVCTHLGCIVPWNTVEKKFMCPCHGSQYDNMGTVIKGPATRSLKLANVDIEDDKVVFVPWKETDFRKR